jgi:hypothetical protein
MSTARWFKPTQLLRRIWEKTNFAGLCPTLSVAVAPLMTGSSPFRGTSFRSSARQSVRYPCFKEGRVSPSGNQNNSK